MVHIDFIHRAHVTHNLIHDEQLQGHKSGTNLNSRPKQQVP